MHLTGFLQRSLCLGHLFIFVAGALDSGTIDSHVQPVVSLGYGSFRGNETGDIVQFLGMPFAAPPVGNLRFAPPQSPLHFTGIRNATSYGNACFQQDLKVADFFGNLTSTVASGLAVSGGSVPAGISEDCLFINIIKPSNIPSGKKLPVVFWIYAGGFSVGDTSFYPGQQVVERSISLGQPVIYVSANYRVSALGFLGGQEIKDAGLGNSGLRDQRFALQWVQDHISVFGGDPRRVTLWGQSAGAVSTGIHLVLNDGDPAGLFHGAFMESGSPIFLADIASKQIHFDELVANTNCSSEADKLACLRTINDPWIPSVDGIFIQRDPQESIRQGLFAKVPIVSGDCDDEGTTDAEFLEYIKTNYFQSRISDENLNAIGIAYSSNPNQGSPFDTGSANARTPQYKRLAAIQGDIVFHAPRRYLLQAASKTQPAYSFLWKRGKSTPYLGAFHASDVPEFYGSVVGGPPDFIGTDAVVNFVNTGNPGLPRNPKSLLSKVDWKPWGSSKTSPPLLTFLDPAPAIAITSDDFRVDAMKLLTNASLVAFGGRWTAEARVWFHALAQAFDKLSCVVFRVVIWRLQPCMIWV